MMKWRIYDAERLAAYQQIISTPHDPSVAHRYGHHITVPVTNAPQLKRMAAHFIQYILERQGLLDESRGEH